MTELSSFSSRRVRPLAAGLIEAGSYSVAARQDKTRRDDFPSRLELARGFLVSSRRKYRDPFLVSSRTILERIRETRRKFDISRLVSS